MPVTPDQCVNYEINLQMCPCSSDTCDFRGICCECIRDSIANNAKTACMNGTKRDPATMSLNSQASSDCQNAEINLAECVCTWEPCNKKGICCNCVRNHFTTSGTDRVACMR